MIYFIPLNQYEHYFDVAILIMILVAVWQCHTGNILKSNNVNANAMWGTIITVLLFSNIGKENGRTENALYSPCFKSLCTADGVL